MNAVQVIDSNLSNVGEYSGISQNTSDDRLIEIWLSNNKSKNTLDAYRRDIDQFLMFVETPIQDILFEDLVEYAKHIGHLKESSQMRKRNSVKSLFTLAHQVGYIRVNPAAAWKSKELDDNLAERIMTEEDVMMMLAKEENPRNHAIIRLLYNAGLRVSELCALLWGNIQPNSLTGWQVNVLGKGAKKRSVPISQRTFEEISKLHGIPKATDYVFPSHYGDKIGHITRTQVFNIVENAAIKAGLYLYTDERGRTRSRVSPHWLRHAHASHAIDAGAPITLVRDTMGHENIRTTDRYAHAKPKESSSTYLNV